MRGLTRQTHRRKMDGRRSPSTGWFIYIASSQPPNENLNHSYCAAGQPIKQVKIYIIYYDKNHHERRKDSHIEPDVRRHFAQNPLSLPFAADGAVSFTGGAGVGASENGTAFSTSCSGSSSTAACVDSVVDPPSSSAEAGQ